MIRLIYWLLSFIRFKSVDRRLEGYVYIIEDLILGTIRIGSSISLSKIDDIISHYYYSSNFTVHIIHKTSNTSHTARRQRLQELTQHYINKYGQTKIVLQI